MRKVDRQNYIISLLESEPDTTVSEISTITGVSPVTIRKDLTEMERDGLLTRYYGHAKLKPEHKSQVNSCFISSEKMVDYQAKQIIGELASRLVEDEDFIFIGPGYTCLEFAKKLIGKKMLSVLTTNISASIELSSPDLQSSDIKLRVAPGDFTRRNGTYYVTGMNTIDYLSSFYFDKIFITVDSISDRGFSVLDEVTACIFRSMMKPSTKVYICAAGGKFGKNAPAYLGDFNIAHSLITDVPVPDHYREKLQSAGIEIYCPE